LFWLPSLWLFVFSAVFLLSRFFLHCYPHPRGLHSFPTRRSSDLQRTKETITAWSSMNGQQGGDPAKLAAALVTLSDSGELPQRRSEEHTSELQSRFDLVCRLLLEKKKTTKHDEAG